MHIYNIFTFILIVVHKTEPITFGKEEYEMTYVSEMW